MGRHRRPTRWDASAAPITRNPRRELRTGIPTTPTGERMPTLGADPARPRIGNPLIQDTTKHTTTPGASRICPRIRMYSIQGTNETKPTLSRTRRKNPRRRSTTSSPGPAPRGYAGCSSPARPQGSRLAGPPPRRDTDRMKKNPTGGRTHTPPPPTGRSHRPELWDDEDDEELPSGRDRRPELWSDEDDEDLPHSAQFTDPRLAGIPKEAPRGAGAPDDGGVPYCAQFAAPQLPTKTREPPEDEGGVPYCAQYADAAALRERERWGGKSEQGEDASTRTPDHR